MSEIHYTWLEDWIPIDTFKEDLQSHTAISEFTSGVEQAAELWDRSKKAYELSIQIDREDTAKIDALLYLKRILNGQAGRVWVPEPLASLLVEEHAGTGDGASVGFVLPTIGDFDGAGFPKIYDAGVFTDLGGREGTANEVSEDLGRALDETLWDLTNAAAYAETNYQWQANERCTEIVASAAGVVTAEAELAERVSAAWPTGTKVYVTVALRGDVAQDMKVGAHFYNSTPASISTLYGTAATIVEGGWTLVSSGALSVPAAFDSAAVIIESDGALASADSFYIGGVCLNILDEGWWDPVTRPNVIQFPTAPALGNEVTFSGRARQMRKMRLAADNMQHAIGTMGHVNVARLKLLEVL